MTSHSKWLLTYEHIVGYFDIYKTTFGYISETLAWIKRVSPFPLLSLFASMTVRCKRSSLRSSLGHVIIGEMSRPGFVSRWFTHAKPTGEEENQLLTMASMLPRLCFQLLLIEIAHFLMKLWRVPVVKSQMCMKSRTVHSRRKIRFIQVT